MTPPFEMLSYWGENWKYKNKGKLMLLIQVSAKFEILGSLSNMSNKLHVHTCRAGAELPVRGANNNNREIVRFRQSRHFSIISEKKKPSLPSMLDIFMEPNWSVSFVVLSISWDSSSGRAFNFLFKSFISSLSSWNRLMPSHTVMCKDCLYNNIKYTVLPITHQTILWLLNLTHEV